MTGHVDQQVGDDYSGGPGDEQVPAGYGNGWDILESEAS